MSKISRNARCPCGSGRKYKHCCGKLGQPTPTPPPADNNLQWVLDSDPLDDLSNQVPDLIRAGNLEAAESVCRTLKARYPDAIDWRHRYAEVYEAQGRFQEAAEHHRLAADFASTAPGFDAEAIDDMRNEAQRLTALAAQP